MPPLWADLGGDGPALRRAGGALGPLQAPTGWQAGSWTATGESQNPRFRSEGAARRRARAPVPPLGSPRLRRRGVPMRLRGPQPCALSRACPGLSRSAASSLHPGVSAASPGRARRPLVAMPRVSGDLWPGAARLRAGLLLAPGASSRRPASITAGAPGRKAGLEMRGLLKGQCAFSGLRLSAPGRAPALRATPDPLGAKEREERCVLLLFFFIDCELRVVLRIPQELSTNTAYVGRGAFKINTPSVSGSDIFQVPVLAISSGSPGLGATARNGGG